jgi:hypothetical protein
MSTRAHANYYEGTPSEMIIVSGETDSKRTVEIAIPSEMAITLLTKGAEAYRHCRHVGHALWHVKNNNTDFDNCSTCKYHQENPDLL